MLESGQSIPSSGPDREKLREKGQFWTPPWVAEAMVGYLLAGGHKSIFDPAIGAGAFFNAAKSLMAEGASRIKLLGTELDPKALKQARQNGLSDEDLAAVEIRDFISDPPEGPFEAIVANPPYIRHHRLAAHTKSFLKSYGARLIGSALDGRAGLHVYFLLRALELLADDGRLAFIVPADTCEGIFARTLWRWISANYRLDAVVTFSPEASPFPTVDTNPIILMLAKRPPGREFLCAMCEEAETPELKVWTLSGFQTISGNALSPRRRLVSEAVSTGLSRAPGNGTGDGPTLSAFATIMRGIATGANDFFHLTRARAEELAIPQEFLLPAVARTRDVPGHELTEQTLDELEAAGRPTLLFSPDGRPLDRFPGAVQRYLRYGEDAGLPDRVLLSTRRPWYKMEVRPVPPILFAYLGRRNVRFIRNLARAVPLTGFLCVYPRRNEAQFVGKLFEVLSHSSTIANLAVVGKSYGGGAIKVEPRALERLPLAADLIQRAKLAPPSEQDQLTLPWGR